MAFSSERVYHLGTVEELIPDATYGKVPGTDTVKECAAAFSSDVSAGVSARFSGNQTVDIRKILDTETAIRVNYQDVLSSFTKNEDVRAFIRDRLREDLGEFSANVYWTIMSPDFVGSNAERCVQAGLADSAAYGCLAAIAVIAGTGAAANPGTKLACSMAGKTLAKYTWGAAVSAVNYSCEKVGGGVCDTIEGEVNRMMDSRGSGAVWAAEWALPPVAAVRGIAELKKLFGACNSPNWNGLAAQRLEEAKRFRFGLVQALWASWFGMRDALDPPLVSRPPMFGDFMLLVPPEWKSAMGEASWPPRIALGCTPSDNQENCWNNYTNEFNNVLGAMLDSYAMLLGMQTLAPRQLTSGSRALDLVVMRPNFDAPLFGASPEPSNVAADGAWVINTYDWPDCPNDDDMADFDRLVNLAIESTIYVPYNLAYSRVLDDIRAMVAAESTGLCIGATNTKPCYPRINLKDCKEDQTFDFQRGACVAKPALTLPLDGQCSSPSRPYLRMTPDGPRCGAAPPPCRPGLVGTFPNCQIPQCPSMQRSTIGITPQCIPALRAPKLSFALPSISKAIQSANISSASKQAATIRKTDLSRLVAPQMQQPSAISRLGAQSVRLKTPATMTSKALTEQVAPSKLPIFLLGAAILGIIGYVLYEETK